MRVRASFVYKIEASFDIQNICHVPRDYNANLGGRTQLGSSRNDWELAYLLLKAVYNNPLPITKIANRADSTHSKIEYLLTWAMAEHFVRKSTKPKDIKEYHTAHRGRPPDALYFITDEGIDYFEKFGFVVSHLRLLSSEYSSHLRDLII